MTISESNDHPGFFVIPGNDDVLISMDGRVIGLRHGQELTVSVRNHGYLSVNTCYTLANKKIHRQYLIHRLLAMVFIPVPEHLARCPLRKLQINHIDGDKLNNAFGNLEWCTPKENMRHAFANKLIRIAIAVYAKNLITGELLEFKTQGDCANYFAISRSSLVRHLNSKDVGKRTKEWHVFSMHAHQWPELKPHECREDTWNFNGVFLAINAVSRKIIIYNTLKEACAGLSLEYIHVQNHRRTHGFDTPFNDWVFEARGSLEGLDASVFENRSNYKGRTPMQRFNVHDTRTGVSTIHTGIKSVAALIDYSDVHISGYLNEGKNTFGPYCVSKLAA